MIQDQDDVHEMRCYHPTPNELALRLSIAETCESPVGFENYCVIDVERLSISPIKAVSYPDYHWNNS